MHFPRKRMALCQPCRAADTAVPVAPVVAVHAAGHDGNLRGPKPAHAFPALFDRLSKEPERLPFRFFAVFP